MIRNHAEKKRAKVRIIINYKKININTIFDGYYITQKIIPFNRTQEASWFSKRIVKEDIGKQNG